MEEWTGLDWTEEKESWEDSHRRREKEGQNRVGC
jgi:hypothetical protein